MVAHPRGRVKLRGGDFHGCAKSLPKNKSRAHGKNLDGLFLARKHHITKILSLEIFAQTVARGAIDQDRALGGFRVLFNTRRNVDRIADARVGGAMLCAGVPRNDSPGGNADADLDLPSALRGRVAR
jgi:hypothetical protein